MSAMLEIRGLEIGISTPAGTIRAVRGVDLTVPRGEVLAIVGESGSGKSLTVMSIPGLLPPLVRVERGEALLGGEDSDLFRLPRQALNRVRGRRIGVIFQDPMTSLNPALRIGRQLTEAYVSHGRGARSEAYGRARMLLEKVGIGDPDRRFEQYPHELSGGLRQRVMIAMALMCAPDLIIADEATTALDVTVQRKVLLLLKELQREYALSMIFVSHNFGAVAQIADRIAVMYAGRVVEQGGAEEILRRPRHPYTSGLIASVPRTDAGRDEKFAFMPGAAPSVMTIPARGCAFAPRCARAVPACMSEDPVLAELAPGHGVACLRPLGEGMLDG